MTIPSFFSKLVRAAAFTAPARLTLYSIRYMPMLLSCHNISKAFVDHTVLTDVSFQLDKGDKAAIVGINGAGKTTLLRIITGETEPDSGTVSIQRGTKIGYLAQRQDLDGSATIYETMLEVKKDVLEMEKQIARDEKEMQTLKGEALTVLMTRYTDLLHRFEMENGYAYKGEIIGVLRGLGFADEDFDKPVENLSGGQKTRVALGRLLLSNPPLILLDEPTNHLDMNSIRWLETYVQNYRGSVLIVSHDRYFLDRTVTRIIELENTRAFVYPGNYTAYAELKKARREAERKAYLNNQAAIRHQEEVIAKLRRFNREKSIKRAESREKMLARMDRVEKPVELRDDMRLVLKPCIKSGREVMSVEGLSKSFGDLSLFSDVSFQIRRGEHVALIGDNGTGKTTLLRIINELTKADSGRIRLGTNVHIGYYDQEQHVLNDENTVFEEISDAQPSMTNTEIRNLLASFLFTGEDVFKLIRSLSGGEKGRVSLAKLMLSKANFLILDEPTNHLDVTSKEVLENALNSYTGTVFYVSHDRYFINRTASRILTLTDRVILDYPGNGSDKVPDRFIGNYDFYLEKSAQIRDTLLRNAAAAARGVSYAEQDQVMPKEITGPAPVITEAAAHWKKQKEDQARRRKARAALKRCEESIAALESEGKELDAMLQKPEVSTDVEMLTRISSRRSEIEDELARLYEEWEVLSEEEASL